MENVSSSFRRNGLDHLDGAAVFRARLDDQGSGADETLEVGALLKGDRSGAENLAPDLTVDVGGGCVDGIEKLDSSTLFHPQVLAVHLADDFTMAADDEVA